MMMMKTGETFNRNRPKAKRRAEDSSPIEILREASDRWIDAHKIYSFEVKAPCTSCQVLNMRTRSTRCIDIGRVSLSIPPSHFPQR